MRSILSGLAVFLFLGCSTAQKENFDTKSYWGEDHWPEIRRQRLDKLLPMAIKEAIVNAGSTRYLTPSQEDLILNFMK